LNVTGTLRIGNDNGSVGVMNLESGSVILSHTGWGADETHIGHGGGVATLNIAGGSLSASRNFRLGNDRGNGTINITGGSLTVAGTDDVFIGRDKGTAVVNQSGGVVEFNHNTFIANGNNQSDPTTGTYNLSDGTLNVKREFVIGREGANGTHIGTLNMTGGTITKTGDEKMIVGHNNGTGYVLHSGGTIYVNQNELFIGNENAGALGTYTLSGTGALNVANELVVGRESGTGILNVDGGTLTTSGNGNMYVGRRNGTGTLNQTAGVISVIREFGVGTRDDNKIGTGTYNLSGGSLTVANNIFIGKEQGSSGTLNMTGGTLGTNESLRIGHNQATGVLSQSAGTVNVQNEVYVGNESNASSVGTYSLSGTGVLNVGNEVHIGRDNGTGTFNLNGGTVNATKISGGNGNATVNFNGGVLKAKRDEANLIENIDVADVQSGGLKINSNGFNVSTSQVFTGTGGLEKLGAGSLTLGSTSTYSGSTNVATGALVVNGNISTSSLTTVNSGATLSGSGTVGAAVIDGTLAVGNSPGQMIFTNTVDLNGITIMEIDGTSGAGVVGGHDFVNLTGAGAAGVLTYGGTLTLDIGTLFGVGTYSWNLFDFASETDSFATISLADQYSGSLLDGDLNGVWDLASGNNTWQFSESTGVLGLTVIPEPSAAVLCGLSMLALLRRRRNA
jgi:autotransporter-associated beta strand protein